ncbi:MBL fold metallo-hydrolase [Pedobacter deserti]|uniref:MBL fold metallo-hydrolase n=1 Tax=Pedobacter deserti TaxID=2817382 RepID=UPI00210A67C0|nr:MBL fold metallo-hydrolase [Pedobacter sp. SYSU D00382]
MITIHSFTFNPVQENTYVLFDETGECVIIDPGMYDSSEQNEFVRFIKDNRLKPVALLNTHCHYDHVFGNRFVYDNWGLKPQFHEGELVVLHAIPGYLPQMGLQYDLSPQPETFLVTGDLVSFGSSRLEVIFAPGHSPGHICFYASKEAFLIGGDVLFYGSIGRTDLPGGNYSQLITSIREGLLVLPEDCKVYPGHGPSTTIGFEKQHNPFLR